MRVGPKPVSDGSPQSNFFPDVECRVAMVRHQRNRNDQAKSHSKSRDKVSPHCFPSLLLAALPNNLLYFSSSDGEQYISGTSVCGSANFMGNLSMDTHGFVYIFGSSIVTESSKRSWFTRCHRSSTRSLSLIGRPVESSQTLSSGIIPTVWTTSVVSSTHLPTEYP